VDDRHEPVELDPPVPHLDHRALSRISTEQRRVGVQLLKVAADGD
jgi:hypothetical protein